MNTAFIQNKLTNKILYSFILKILLFFDDMKDPVTPQMPDFRHKSEHHIDRYLKYENSKS